MGRTDGRWGSGAAWSAVALAIALIFVLARVLVPDLFMRVAAPALSLGNALSGKAAGIFGGFGDARALSRTNAELRRENATLVLENMTLGAQVADLTTLIPTTSARSVMGVVAGVLARPPTAPYDTLVLSAGTDAGVRLLMGAFGASGTPLGVVSEASPRFSRVRLFSAPGVATDAWVGEARIPITLQGAGAGAFTASVSQGAGVVVGETVYLPGPGALPVGKVAHVAGAASDPVARLSITPLTNPFSVTWVVLAEVPSTRTASSTVSEGEGPLAP